MKIKTSDVIAIIALVVSLATGLFSFYQWKQADAEARITAAIDVSRKYSEDKYIPGLIQAYQKSHSRSDKMDRLLLRLN